MHISNSLFFSSPLEMNGQIEGMFGVVDRLTISNRRPNNKHPIDNYLLI